MRYEERAYQQEAIAECVAAFADRGRASVLLESPVGSGKTYMALETVHRLQERLGRRLKVNWVAPRHRLLQQMMAANRDLYQDDIRPVSLFESLPREADLVVLDEAHHEATKSCVLLYEKMGHSLTLGLSATPMRTDRMKLSFQETVRTVSIARLIREGYLSPFNSYLIPNYTVGEVADFYLADTARWGKSLVFFPTIAECLDFKERLRVGGVACEVVTGESDKDRQMELFESGRVPVVANVAMLTEGFDQPDVQSVFVRDASRLPAIQMCGRGLRLHPGKTACNIVQSANSSYLFERVAAPRNAFRWQGGRWLALKDGTEEIESTLRETLRRIEQRQKRDRKERRAEYRRAARESGDRFSRVIERIDRAERLEREFYGKFGDLYACVERFYKSVGVDCWGGQLPDCAVHFDKGFRGDRLRAEILPDYVQAGGRSYPALAVLASNCQGLSPARLGIGLMYQIARLGLNAQDPLSVSAQDCARELTRLGLVDQGRSYVRGTPFERVLAAAKLHLSPVVERLRPLLWDDYGATAKGDARFFLREHGLEQAS